MVNGKWQIVNSKSGSRPNCLPGSATLMRGKSLTCRYANLSSVLVSDQCACGHRPTRSDAGQKTCRASEWLSHL